MNLDEPQCVWFAMQFVSGPLPEAWAAQEGLWRQCALKEANEARGYPLDTFELCDPYYWMVGYKWPDGTPSERPLLYGIAGLRRTHEPR